MSRGDALKSMKSLGTRAPRPHRLMISFFAGKRAGRPRIQVAKEINLCYAQV